MEFKKYINIYIPVQSCTLRCHYCYITHHRKFDTAIPEFPHSPEFIKKAFSKERLGGICLFNICAGGETLIPKEVVSYIKVLLEEGHFVQVVTNATLTKRFEEISKFDKKLLGRLAFKFSYHYLQHKEKNLTELFFSNVNMMKKAGCAFTLEITPSDELIPHIEDIKKEAIKYVGAIPHCTVARDERYTGFLPILTNLSKEDYKNIWSTFDSELFNYKFSVFGIKRREFCYAGSWSCIVNINTGEWKQCYKSFVTHNIYTDITKPFPDIPIGNNCKEIHCYNAHGFVVLGTIPKLKSPTYEHLRNRICNDGSEWLSSEMKEMYSSRLYETNKQLNLFQRWKANRFIKNIGKTTKIRKFINILKKITKIKK